MSYFVHVSNTTKQVTQKCITHTCAPAVSNDLIPLILTHMFHCKQIGSPNKSSLLTNFLCHDMVIRIIAIILTNTLMVLLL